MSIAIPTASRPTERKKNMYFYNSCYKQRVMVIHVTSLTIYGHDPQKCQSHPFAHIIVRKQILGTSFTVNSKCPWTVLGTAIGLPFNESAH